MSLGLKKWNAVLKVRGEGIIRRCSRTHMAKENKSQLLSQFQGSSKSHCKSCCGWEVLQRWPRVPSSNIEQRWIGNNHRQLPNSSSEPKKATRTTLVTPYLRAIISFLFIRKHAKESFYSDMEVTLPYLTRRTKQRNIPCRYSSYV
jgi:hypothetical protein